MMKKVWKVCVTLILVCTLLPANVYAESGLTLESSLESGTETLATESPATESPATEIPAIETPATESVEPSQNEDTYLNAAVSERADSDGDADLPAFFQAGESACGTVSADQVLSPSTATVSDVVSLIQPIIFTNEVGPSWNTKYGSVNPNDNGYGISAGIIQWNASNALNLLKAMIVTSDAEAQQILGADLYNKIRTDQSWDGRYDSTRFIPTDAQAVAISNLLKSATGIAVQNSIANAYIFSYIDRGYNTYKITNIAALSYFCDINNQCGPTTVGNIVNTAIQLAGGNPSYVTLNEMHEAALLNSVAGKYLYRRYLTYDSIADAISGTGWNYTNAGSYRIPASTVWTGTATSEIQWLQWALNATIQAGLPVNGTYNDMTKTAVRAFQTQYQAMYGLAVDGYAGQQTITALIKVLNDLHQLTFHSNDMEMVEPVLKSADNTATGVTVSWESVPNATGYYVYRKDNGGDYRAIGTISSGSMVSYSDTTVTSGTTYTYTVKAYDSWGESSCNNAGISILFQQAPVSQTPVVQTPVSQTPDLQAPDLHAAVMTTTGIKISWSQVGGAIGYYVYRKVSGGSYSKIKNIKSGSTVSYTDKTTKSGTTYTYTVRAYNGSVYSDYKKGISQTYKAVKKYKVLSKLNYRKGPGKKYAAVGTLKKSSTVYVVKGYSKKANGYTWYKIYYKNKFYYVASKYLKKI